nr:Gag-Pol polyprotein [Tanacetum cinerariifolium]
MGLGSTITWVVGGVEWYCSGGVECTGEVYGGEGHFGGKSGLGGDGGGIQKPRKEGEGDLDGFFLDLHIRSYLKELALQGLRGSKKLKPGALSLYVGDGHRATVEAIGTYHLELPSGLVIILNNYHYAPSIT